MTASLWQRLARQPQHTPDDKWLEHCLDRNSNTRYLRQHGSPRTVDDFRDRIPLVSYDELRPWLEEIERGDSDVLFAGRPVAFERTGGSTGGTKLIPYSLEGLEDFRRALLPWLLGGAKAHGVTGRVYLAISPAARAHEHLHGVPVGLTDGAYLGEAVGAILSKLSIVPFELAGVEDIGRWRAETLRHLSHAEDLELISCWSPTFFLRLLDELDDPVDLWPHLKLVSCWAAASSRPYADALMARMPHARLQPKGLMSTESVVTVPDENGRPVLTPHGFFEFLEGRRTRSASELVTGSTYEVVVTTASGLYRYRTGDLVSCVDSMGPSLPVLEFMGRGGLTADLVGEKLTEGFVSTCLEDVPGFRVLAPATDRSGYVLATETGACEDIGRIERKLRANPQYDYARRLGQLRAVRLAEVNDLFDRYVDAQIKGGVRLGDVKPIALRTEPDWLSSMGVSL
jgi:GH3 auxin-responsive promoter